MKHEILLLLVIIIIEKTLELSNIKTEDTQFKITKYIAENSHITLVCPESSPDSYIKWFKDNRLLNSSYRNNMAEVKEPHITIDAFNSLHLLHVTRNEEGIYTCSKDGKTLEEWMIKVASETKLLNKEFFRYSLYLGFVLSLTATCYCAGVCVAWHRKGSFMDPLNLNAKPNYRYFQTVQEK